MACIEIPTDVQAELMQTITELVIAAAGDKQLVPGAVRRKARAERLRMASSYHL